MLDEKTWKIETDRGKIEKLIKYHMPISKKSVSLKKKNIFK